MATTTWTLKGGTIVDGTGRPRATGDVVIEDDRIASVGPAASSGTVTTGRREPEWRGTRATGAHRRSAPRRVR